MIFAVGMLLIFIGIMGLSMDLFVPAVDMATVQLIGISNLFGLMFSIIGAIVIGVRTYQTGMSPFLDIPNSKRVILFHHRRGKNPNVSTMIGKLLDLEYISTKGKLFKDTGGGFRLAGHDCRTTHETIAFDIPEWLMDWFYQVKTTFGIRNRDQLLKLAEQLRGIHKPVDGNKKLLELELGKIELLEPIMKDDERKEQLLSMGYDRLRNLELFCCDGVTHHHEEVEEFIESATPNDVDTLVKQKFLNDQMKASNYREPGSTFNYETLIPVFIALFIGILGAIVFMSYMGAS